jgi:hypothetical protein
MQAYSNSILGAWSRGWWGRQKTLDKNVRSVQTKGISQKEDRFEWRGIWGDSIGPKGQQDSASVFNPDLYTQFEETEDTWKASLDGANNTGWKPMLHCFPECRAISRGHPGAISANPRQPRDGVK